MVLPFPTFQDTPNFAALLAHSTPFQKGEAPFSGQQKTLGSVVSYL